MRAEWKWTFKFYQKRQSSNNYYKQLRYGMKKILCYTIDTLSMNNKTTGFLVSDNPGNHNPLRRLRASRRRSFAG